MATAKPSLKPSRSPSLKGSIRTITPRLAAQWLEANPRNRRVRKAIVNAYARDMTEGRWHLTGEAIIFNEEGKLDNGQHRLLACVQSNTAFKAFVVTGTTMEAQKYMDTGIPRSTSDALLLSLAVESNVTGYLSAVASTARAILLLENVDKPSKAEVLDFSEKNFDLLVTAARHARAIHAAIGGRPTTYSVALYYIYQVAANPLDVIDFFAKVTSGQNLSATDSALLLRNRILRTPLKPSGVSNPHQLRIDLAAVYKAWNSYRSNTPMPFLRINSADELPELVS